MSKKIKLKRRNTRSNFWNKINNILAVLAITLGAFYFVFSNFLNISKRQLEYHVLTNTSIIEIKEDIAKLNIEYDSINFIKDNKNISFIILEIKNIGSQSISSNDYDINIPFGVKILNSELIKSPNLIKSSDDDYFKNVLLSNTKDEIILSKKIIDEGEFFQLKFYLIHDTNVKPEIEFLGKISGQKNIQIIKQKEVNQIEYEKNMLFNKLTTILSVALITILCLLTLSLFKNNNILLKHQNLLHLKNKDLLESLNRHNLELEKIKKKIQKEK